MENKKESTKVIAFRINEKEFEYFDKMAKENNYPGVSVMLREFALSSSVPYTTIRLIDMFKELIEVQKNFYNIINSVDTSKKELLIENKVILNLAEDNAKFKEKTANMMNEIIDLLHKAYDKNQKTWL